MTKRYQSRDTRTHMRWFGAGFGIGKVRYSGTGKRERPNQIFPRINTRKARKVQLKWTKFELFEHNRKLKSIQKMMYGLNTKRNKLLSKEKYYFSPSFLKWQEEKDIHIFTDKRKYTVACRNRSPHFITEIRNLVNYFGEITKDGKTEQKFFIVTLTAGAQFRKTFKKINAWRELLLLYTYFGECIQNRVTFFLRTNEIHRITKETSEMKPRINTEEVAKEAGGDLAEIAANIEERLDKVVKKAKTQGGLPEDKVDSDTTLFRLPHAHFIIMTTSPTWISLLQELHPRFKRLGVDITQREIVKRASGKGVPKGVNARGAYLYNPFNYVLKERVLNNKENVFPFFIETTKVTKFKAAFTKNIGNYYNFKSHIKALQSYCEEKHFEVIETENVYIPALLSLDGTKASKMSSILAQFLAEFGGYLYYERKEVTKVIKKIYLLQKRVKEPFICRIVASGAGAITEVIQTHFFTKKDAGEIIDFLMDGRRFQSYLAKGPAIDEKYSLNKLIDVITLGNQGLSIVLREEVLRGDFPCIVLFEDIKAILELDVNKGVKKSTKDGIVEKIKIDVDIAEGVAAAVDNKLLSEFLYFFWDPEISVEANSYRRKEFLYAWGKALFQMGVGGLQENGILFYGDTQTGKTYFRELLIKCSVGDERVSKIKVRKFAFSETEGSLIVFLDELSGNEKMNVQTLQNLKRFMSGSWQSADVKFEKSVSINLSAAQIIATRNFEISKWLDDDEIPAFKKRFPYRFQLFHKPKSPKNPEGKWDPEKLRKQMGALQTAALLTFIMDSQKHRKLEPDNEQLLLESSIKQMVETGVIERTSVDEKGIPRKTIEVNIAEKLKRSLEGPTPQSKGKLIGEKGFPKDKLKLSKNSEDLEGYSEILKEKALNEVLKLSKHTHVYNRSTTLFEPQKDLNPKGRGRNPVGYEEFASKYIGKYFYIKTFGENAETGKLFYELEEWDSTGGPFNRNDIITE